jgi:hypothetical protein
MTKLDIITPGPEIDDDPAAIALWNDTGNFIGSALARMERGRAFSIILARPLLACPGEGQEVSIEPQSPQFGALAERRSGGP